ncbi:LexA repressor [Vibrio quintilis]|uniref:LexA repressor n=2 Tax=Vibrio quintilis TaxID=1117707 RepID=A0A1M7YP22_9VIBR|nr:S24 family peptidase [Vibrio quintilis]SHO54380.1 LexA repressor [Vibrio quintilis]
MDTFGQRFEWRRRLLGLNQDDVVYQVKRLMPGAKFNRGTVSNIENNSQKSLKDGVFLMVCKILQCRPEWLAFGKGPVEDSESKASRLIGPPVEQKCPIWTFSQAAMWTSMGAPTDIDDMDLIPCPIPASPGVFALKVKDNSMETQYLEGDFIFVDPNQQEPSSGSHIVAILENAKEATFRVFIEMDGKKSLQALNKDYPPEMRYTTLNDASMIIGTIICSVRVM